MGRFGKGVLIMVATASASGTLQLTTERAVVFKDGHALLVKRAEGVADARGTVFTDSVPDGAVLGAFWAWTEHGPSLRSLRAEWVLHEVEREVRGACADPAAILCANPGKRVTVELEHGSLTGTVLALPSPVLPPAEPEPRAARAALYEASAAHSVPPSAQVVALAVPEQGTVVLAGRDIRRVTGAELSLECRQTVRATEKRKRLSLDFGAEAAGQPLTVWLAYFTPGLRWIPTYRLDVQDGGPGSLALQAELVNELEDLHGAPLDLVVGVPNFRFKDVASPLSLEGVVRNTLAQAAPSRMGGMNQMSNALFSQRAGEWRGGPEEPESAAPRIPEFGGPGESPDFYVYPVAPLELPRGARAVVPLWREEVPTHDLYTLDVRVRRDDTGEDRMRYGRDASADSGSPLRLSQGEVWHQLEVKNRTKHPLTTGPVLVMRGQLPQAQELLTYTPRGGRTLVPLTVATDVRSLHEESELERKEDALKSHGNRYARIRKKGTLTLFNPRAERLALRVHLSTGGKVEQVSKDGLVKVDDFRAEDWEDRRLALVNAHSDVEWTLILAPGERRELTYEVGFWR